MIICHEIFHAIWFILNCTGLAKGWTWRGKFFRAAESSRGKQLFTEWLDPLAKLLEMVANWMLFIVHQSSNSFTQSLPFWLPNSFKDYQCHMKKMRAINQCTTQFCMWQPPFPWLIAIFGLHFSFSKHRMIHRAFIQMVWFHTCTCWYNLCLYECSVHNSVVYDV